jgi:hypothetical protein
MRRDPDALALRAALAFLWLATGLGVFSAYYREIGVEALDRLGLPEWPMYAACAGEVLLGLAVLSGRAAGAVAAGQAVLIVSFTVVLGVSQPALLAHPFGVLTKNVPLLAFVGVVWLHDREGWSPRAVGLLRLGTASIWLLEGLLPLLLFPSDEMRQIVAGLIPWFDAATLLPVIGVCQIAAAALVLLLRGRPLRLLLAALALGLVVIIVVVTRHDARLWLHPFGPLTKNVTILAGTIVSLRRVDSAREAADNRP